MWLLCLLLLMFECVVIEVGIECLMGDFVSDSYMVGLYMLLGCDGLMLVDVKCIDCLCGW